MSRAVSTFCFESSFCLTKECYIDEHNLSKLDIDELIQKRKVFGRSVCHDMHFGS